MREQHFFGTMSSCKTILLLLALITVVPCVFCFSPTALRSSPPSRSVVLSLSPWRRSSSNPSLLSSRRMAGDDDNAGGSGATRVTVVGGTGFVGSRVCKLLAETDGISVRSLSKTGIVPAWCRDDDWTKRVEWIATGELEVLEAADDGGAAVDRAVTGGGAPPDCLVSCLGVIGTDPEKLRNGNGGANRAAFASAKRVCGGTGATLKRAVFVSVGSEVAACRENWLPEFFGGYFDGKRDAEKAALDAVGGDEARLCLVRPTFVYGGDSFGLLPPRVTAEYGSAIEELLSSRPFEFLAESTPGLIKVAFRPPSSVDAVAEACASAALGGPALGKVLDGGTQINGITDRPPATGLTDAIKWAKAKTLAAVEWVKDEGVPQLVARVEEIQKK